MQDTLRVGDEVITAGGIRGYVRQLDEEVLKVEILSRPEVQELIGREVEAANKKFARVETVKKFRLIDQLLTAEDEELTPTMKLKRSLVEQKYGELIKDMYAA